MNINNLKIDPSKVIGLALAGIGLVQMVLSDKAKNYERENLKAEIRKEILTEMRSSN